MPSQFRFSALVMLFLSLVVVTTGAEHSNTAAAAWLERVNFYRATAALPPVVEEPSLSTTVTQHARYMVANDVIDHWQNHRRSWATSDGAAAAAASNLAGSTNATEPDWWAVDVWMQAPFHAIGILDPALLRVGFGIHRERDGRRIQTAAGLDVIRGRSHTAPEVTYPVVWPAHGTAVPIGAHTSEYPSPLASCPGYTAPAGLPIIVQMGNGSQTPVVTRTSISDGSRMLEHCAFDETTYHNPRRVEQDLGRNILASRDAVVVIPREPLQTGRSYQVQMESNGRAMEWTFRVGGE